MRIILIIILTLFINISFSQTVEELEYELSFYKSGESWGEKKDVAKELLVIDGLNFKAISYLVEVYGRNNQKDSIRILYERIIKNNPNSPEPYLIRVRNRNPHFEGLTYTQQINFLKEAQKLDNTNKEALYMLGKKYYELFLKEYKKNKKKENLDYYARNSISYLSDLCAIDKRNKETMKYPLIQLTNYLGDDKGNKEFKSYNYQSSYFPIVAFSGLPMDWDTNYSIDVIWGIESAVFSLNWYSGHLKALDELALSDSLPLKIFRFTWLRTFHNPIVIGIENMNDTIKLYWKVNDGAGGYEPGKIIEDKSKILTLKEWTGIVDKINAIDFWNLPSTENEILGTDGAQWILEGKELGKYHVVDRWSGGEIGKICLELISLTDLKIKEGDIY